MYTGDGDNEFHDPTDPPIVFQEAELQRDERLEGYPLNQQEREILEIWKDGNFDLSQVEQMQALLNAIDLKYSSNN